MKRTSAVLIAAIAVFAGMPAFAQAQTVTVKEAKPGLLKKAKITSEVAIATAQTKLPNAKLSAAEIEDEGGKLIYSFDFATAGKTGIDEVNIDALTGKLVGKVQHESPEAEKKEAAKDAKDAAKKAAKKP